MAEGATPRRSRVALLLCAALTLVSGLLGQPAVVSASTNAALQGALAVFPIPNGAAPVQLFAGTDGRLWFVTAGSQLGEISSGGQATLTGVTLPHGSSFGFSTPATIAAAGTEGVWSFAAIVNNPPGTSSCTVTLVRPDGQVMQPTLPPSLTDFACTGGAADGSGALWLGLASSKFKRFCNCRVAFVAEITTTGQISLFAPVLPGRLPVAVVLGADGAILALEGLGGGDQVIGRYTPNGPPTLLGSAGGRTQDMLPRPDGSVWLLSELFCSGLPGACAKVEVLQPGGASSSGYLYPVTQPGGNLVSLRTAVAPDGSLWMAGQEVSGLTRFFRMDANGQIDRSSVLTAPGGAAVHADGPITVTPAGAVWTVASDSGSTYLYRFTPAAPVP